MIDDIDVKKICLDGDICNVVYGYGNTLDEHLAFVDKIFNDVEDLLITIYKERYLELSIGSRCKPAYDGVGNRYCKCIHCDEIKDSTKFIVYGDARDVNKGICRECYDNYERSKEDGKEEYSDIINYLNSCIPTVSHIRKNSVC